MLFLLAFSCAKAQSKVNITIADSSLCYLEVNTVPFVDSLINAVSLNFSSQNQAHFTFRDTLKNVILEESIFLIANTSSDYELMSLPGDKYQFQLLSQTATSSIAALNSDELTNETQSIENKNSTFSIHSPFKEPKSPNADLLDSLDKCHFESERLKVIKELINNNPLSNNELMLCLSKISYEDKRASLIVELKDKLQNRLTKSDIDALFKLEKYKSTVLGALELS